MKTPRLSTFGALVATLVLSAVSLIDVSAALGMPPAYPDPPPDFSHPTEVHSELYNPEVGSLDRPLLVLFVQFGDVVDPVSDPAPDRGAAWARRRFFGPSPSVRDYYRATSFGEYQVTPAPETSDVADDGIVILNFADGDNGEDPDTDVDIDGDGQLREDPPNDKDDDGDNPVLSVDGTDNDGDGVIDEAREGFDEDPDNDVDNDGDGLKHEDTVSGDGQDDDSFAAWAGQSTALDRNGAAIFQAARDFVDFSALDTREPFGFVDETELLIAVMRESIGGDVFGQTPGVRGAGLVDGVNVDFESAAQFTTATNIITASHELLHAGLDLVDFYGFGVGHLDIAGPTLSSVEKFFAPNAYNKLHWGWIRPTVVTRDGFYDVHRASASGEAFILYDPDPSNPDQTNDYFLVENRQQTPSTYDADASDSGLVIWRVDDDELFAVDATEDQRTVELMRPDGLRNWGCKDDDVDGRNDEDPAGGTPLENGGGVDLDRSGTAGEQDDGSYLGFQIIDGSFNLDGSAPTGATDETAIDARDTGTIAGVSIIVGRVDANGDGGFSAEDNFDPWGGVDNDGDDPALTTNGLDDDRDGTVDEANEGFDEDGPGPGCYSGTELGFANTDAWDPSDPQTPQRTMERPWRDGRASNVAVRAIGPSGPVMRAYFDVRGPGVMVDAYDITSATGTAEVVPGVPTTLFFRVRNTQDRGEPGDRFHIEVPVPSGWHSSPLFVELAAQEEILAGVTLTPPSGETAGIHHLVVTATSTTDPAVTSSSPFVAAIPDALEPNDEDGEATQVDLAHDHTFDSRVLADASRVMDSSELWRAVFDDLNLHDVEDLDVFRLSGIPDGADPADGGHAELLAFPEPECSTIQRRQFDGEIQDIELRSWLSVRVEPRPFPASAGETLHLINPVLGELEPEDPSFTKTIPCPRQERGLGEVHAIFGQRPDRRSDFAEYDIEFEYAVSVQRIPAIAEWLRDQIELRGRASVGPLICQGGFFPNCEGDELIDLDVSHPADVEPPEGCEADGPGCPDFYTFWWSSQSLFDLKFASTSDLKIELLDADQNVIARAIPIEPLSSLSEARTHRPSEAAESRDPVTQRLFASDLDPGFYVLVVRGEQGRYSMRFEPFAAPSDGDGDGLVDAFDACPIESEDADGFEDGDGCPDPDNDQDGVNDPQDNCPNDPNADQADLDADGTGDVCDTENAITIDIKPGSAENKIKLSAKGTTPVAILTTPSFNAPSRIDRSGLTFGRTGDEASLDRCSFEPKDVNGDGLADLICHFVTTATRLRPGDVVGILRGRTLDAVLVEGRDSVKVVP
jgi:hypothetical protein